MQRFFTVLTLTCLMVTFFLSHAAHAMPNDDVNVAEKNEITYERRGDTAFDNVRNAHILYLMAKSEYDKNAAKIERGVAVTASKLLAASVSFYVSGTLTAPILVSAYVDMLKLSGDIHASASLLSVYELTISRKQSAISSFESAKTTYNNKYDTLVGVLATHTGWTKSEIYMYISNDVNRDNGIVHKGSSGSGKHGIVGQNTWGVYDKSLPSYTCKGACSDTFITPTLAKTSHRTSCGTGIDIDIEILVAYPGASLARRLLLAAQRLQTRSVQQGCGRYYYKCPSRLDHGDVQKHKERTCNEWVWEKPSGYLNAFKSYRCGRKFRKCMRHTFDHNPDVIGSSVHSDEADSDSDSGTTETTQNEFQQPTPTPAPTPSYHTCGVHETSVSGTHSAAGCGVSGHYVCDGSDHSLQASCTSTDSNGQYCTVTSFYACQSHTHVYPALPQLVTCARSECNDSVASRYEHRSTCPNCSSINLWSCDAVGVKWHTQVKTCQRTKNGVSCGQSFTSCSNTNTCFYGWKHTGTAHHVN